MFYTIFIRFEFYETFGEGLKVILSKQTPLVYKREREGGYSSLFSWSLRGSVKRSILRSIRLLLLEWKMVEVRKVF